MPTTERLTNKRLLSAIDEKLTYLNLLKAALQGDLSTKQSDLMDYRKRFYDLVNYNGKK
jgi:hypothetical protein